MSYFSYFMYQADKFLDEGGRIATVLPATVLNKMTESGVREMLIDEYTVEYLFAREDALNFSEDTGVREVMLIAQKGQQRDSKATYVSLDELGLDGPTITTAIDEVSRVEIGETRTVSSNNVRATVWQIPNKQLDTHNLFSPFAAHNRDLIQLWREIQEHHQNLTRVADLNTGLTRGGSSHPWTAGCIGGPESYLRNSDIWRIVDSNETEITAKHRPLEEEITIPREALEPYLLRKQYRKHLGITDRCH